jgi:hypothetical protein
MKAAEQKAVVAMHVLAWALEVLVAGYRALGLARPLLG